MLHLPTMADVRKAQRLFTVLRKDLEGLTPKARARLVSYIDERSPGVAHALHDIIREHGLEVEG